MDSSLGPSDGRWRQKQLKQKNKCRKILRSSGEPETQRLILWFCKYDTSLQYLPKKTDLCHPKMWYFIIIIDVTNCRLFVWTPSILFLRTDLLTSAPLTLRLANRVVGGPSQKCKKSSFWQFQKTEPNEPVKRFKQLKFWRKQTFWPGTRMVWAPESLRLVSGWTRRRSTG